MKSERAHKQHVPAVRLMLADDVHPGQAPGRSFGPARQAQPYRRQQLPLDSGPSQRAPLRQRQLVDDDGPSATCAFATKAGCGR